MVVKTITTSAIATNKSSGSRSLNAIITKINRSLVDCIANIEPGRIIRKIRKVGQRFAEDIGNT